MARGQPQGEEVYRPEVSAEDLPRKMVPEIRAPGLIGEGISSLGTALNQKYQADSAAWAGNQLSQIRTQTVQDLENAKAAVPVGDDPGNFAQNFITKFDKNSQGITNNASSNPYAAAMLNKGLSEFRDTLFQHAQEWEAQQRVAFRTDSVKNNIETQSAIIEAHPELHTSIGSSLADQINAVGGDPRTRLALMRQMDSQFSQAAAQGLARQDPRGVLKALDDPENTPQGFEALGRLTDAQREMIRGKANGHLADPVVRALTDGDLAGAQKVLNSSKDIMEPKAAFALQREIDAQVKQKQNEAKADIAGRYQDSLMAAEAGLPNPLTVTRGEMQLLYPKDGSRRFDGLQTMVEAGAQSKAYDKMTPQEIDTDLKSRMPTSGGPEVAFQLKAHDMLERAADKSLRARVSDPAQFAVNRGGWQPLDFSSPGDVSDELQRRAATAPELTAQIGVPVPLLTKQEAKQVSGALENASPNDAMSLLASLHKSLPTENAFGSFLNQVAPHAPVTAVAASLMDTPAKADAPQWYDERFAADPKVAPGIIDGERILSGKGDKEEGQRKSAGFKMPSDNDLLGVYQSEIGGDRSNLFQGRPDTAEMYYDAFKAYYAHLASQRGATTGTIDRSLAQDAAKAVLGETTRFNHTDLVVPRGLDPSQFEDLAKKGITEAAKRAGYSDKEAEPLTDLGLRELGGQLGTGRYVLVDGNGRTLSTADRSGPVIVDLRKVAPGQKQERSFFDLFNAAREANEP